MPYGPWQDGRVHEARLWTSGTGNAPPEQSLDANDPWVEYLTDGAPEPDFRFSHYGGQRWGTVGSLLEVDGGLYGSPGASECVFGHVHFGGTGVNPFTAEGGSCSTHVFSGGTFMGGGNLYAYLTHEGDFYLAPPGAIPGHLEKWDTGAIFNSLVCDPNHYIVYDIAPPEVEWPAGATDVQADQLTERTILELAASGWSGGDAGFECFFEGTGQTFDWSSLLAIESMPSLGGPGGSGVDLNGPAIANLLEARYASEFALPDYDPRFFFAWAAGWPGVWGEGATTWTAHPVFYVSLRWQTSRYRYFFPDGVPGGEETYPAPPLRQRQRHDALGASSALGRRQQNSRQDSLRRNAYL